MCVMPAKAGIQRKIIMPVKVGMTKSSYNIIFKEHENDN